MRRRSDVVPENLVAATDTETIYRSARRNLKHLICAAKSKPWVDLVRTVETDPWGKPHKIVMGKLRGSSVTGSLEPRKIVDIAHALFPDSSMALTIPPSPVSGDSGTGLAVVPEFSSAEMADAVNRFKSRDRAPDLDGITSRIWTIVYDTPPLMVESAFNVCLRTSTFPKRWKRANLALLNKPGKPKGVPFSYRSLCLLDDVGRFSNPCWPGVWRPT